MKLSTAIDTKRILIEAEKLPFPSGEISTPDMSKQFPNKIKALCGQLSYDEEGNIMIPKNAEEMRILAKLFDFCEENGTFAGLDALVDAWNTHNLYFKNNKGLRVTDALVNFISTNMYNISLNPKNWIQGQTPIDTPTGRITKLAEPKPLSVKSQKYDPGNIISKIEMLRLTLTGKENTGIMASGMKVFEAISQYYYNILNSGTLEEMELLAFTDKVNDRIKLIANAYTERVLELSDDTKYNERIQYLQGLLQDVDNTEDAFIVLSAMLSLSTD